MRLVPDRLETDGLARLATTIAASLMALGLLAGIGLRLRMFLMNRALWLDSAALALNLVEVGFGDLFSKLPYYHQSAPVGFLIVSKALGAIFGYSETALTALPLALSLASLVLFAKLSWDFLGAPAAPLALLPLALSSTAIYYAGEFKQYSGDLFFSVLILFAAVRITKSGFTPSRLWTFAAVGVVSAWFSLPSILVVAGAGLALFLDALSEGKRDVARRLAAVGAVLAGHFLILYFLQIRPSVATAVFEDWAADYPRMPTTAESVGWWLRAATGYFQYPLGFGPSLGIPLLGAALGAGVLALDRKQRFRATLLLLPMLFLLLVTALQVYPLATGTHDVHSRFTLFTAPFAFLLIGLGLGEVVRSAKPVPLSLIIVCAFLVFPSARRMIEWPYFIQQEMRTLVADLRAGLAPEDQVYVYAFAVPAFRFYTRNDPISAIEGKTPSNPELDLPADLERMRPRQGRIWIVLAHYFGREQGILEEALRADCTLETTGQYPGARLLGFDCSSQSTPADALPSSETPVGSTEPGS